MIIPAGSHPDAILLEKKKEQQRQFKIKQQQEENRKKLEDERRNQRTPEPLEGRINFETQTDTLYENLTDKPPQYEQGVQSDFYIDRPPTPLFRPQKLGEDAYTQVEPKDPTFDFEEEVEPMLNVLI